MNSRLSLIFAFALSLVPGASRAAELTPETRGAIASYQRTFTAVDLEPMLRYDRVACQPTVQRTLTLVERYGMSALHSLADVDVRYRALQREIHALPACRAAAEKALILGSVYVANAGNLRPRGAEGRPERIGGSTVNGSPILSLEVYTYGLPALYVVSELINTGRLKALTPEIRKSRAVLNPIWLKRAANQTTYRISGTYSCGTSTIWIDPTLRPFNLAGVLYHELDHLFRDKSYVPSDLKSVDWRALLAADETASIFQGASQQLWLKWISTAWSRSPFETTRDLTLVTKDGPLQSILQSTRYGTNRSYLLAYLFCPSCIKERPESTKDGMLPFSIDAPDVALRAFGIISDRVSSSYFSAGRPVESSEIDSETMRTRRSFIAFTSWLRSGAYEEPFPAMSEWAQRREAAARSDLRSALREWLGMDTAAGFDAAIQSTMDGLKLGARSALCDQLQLHSRELVGYVGLGLGSPGGEGVKGTDDEIKLGGEGVKGDDSLVQACVFDDAGI